MRRIWLSGGALLVCLSAFAVAADKPDNATKAGTNAGFEKMKTLVGTWVEADDKGKPTDKVVSVVKLTAGGSAVHETLFPGEPMEMVSIYTPSGSDVVMTHYCMLGNQPQMKAAGKNPGNKLSFEFAGGSNLNPAKDKHMHSAVLTFVDDNHLQVDGVGWEGGKPAHDMCHGMKLVRKQ